MPYYLFFFLNSDPTIHKLQMHNNRHQFMLLHHVFLLQNIDCLSIVQFPQKMLTDGLCQTVSLSHKSDTMRTSIVVSN